MENKEIVVHGPLRKWTQNMSTIEKKEYYSLTGIAIDEDGVPIVSKMFKFLQLDPELYGDIAIKADEAQMIHRRLIGVKWGGAAAKAPLMCGGAAVCPFQIDCPFVELEKKTGERKVPVGRKCPIEVELIAYWVSKYMEEFDVDYQNQSEVSLITELAELDIYDYRCSMILSRAENAEMTQEVTVGMDTEGNPISNEEIHKAWELKERVKNRKQKILESLVGTRKEQYKRDAALKKRSEKDPSTQAAELKESLEAARRDIADMAKPVQPGEDVVEIPEEEV